MLKSIMENTSEFLHFCCGKQIKNGTVPYTVDTRDDQLVWVGAECYKRIKKAGDAGWRKDANGPFPHLISDETAAKLRASGDTTRF